MYQYNLSVVIESNKNQMKEKLVKMIHDNASTKIFKPFETNNLLSYLTSFHLQFSFISDFLQYFIFFHIQHSSLSKFLPKFDVLSYLIFFHIQLSSIFNILLCLTFFYFQLFLSYLIFLKVNFLYLVMYYYHLLSILRVIMIPQKEQQAHDEI